MVLGFLPKLYPDVATTQASTFILADNVANFNVLEYFVVHTDLVGNGIPINGKSRNVIGKVLLTSTPGFLINYTPYNPVQVNIDHLIGVDVTQIDTWLTDQNNKSIQMNDTWSVDMVIRYS